MPTLRKLQEGEVHVLEHRGDGVRAVIAMEYDGYLADFEPSDYGEALLAEGERKLNVKNRLRAAAGLWSSFGHRAWWCASGSSLRMVTRRWMSLARATRRSSKRWNSRHKPQAQKQAGIAISRLSLLSIGSSPEMLPPTAAQLRSG